MNTHQTYLVSVELLPRGSDTRYRVRIFDAKDTGESMKSAHLDRGINEEEEIPDLIMDWLTQRKEWYVGYFPSSILGSGEMKYYIVTVTEPAVEAGRLLPPGRHGTSLPDEDSL